MSTLFSQQTYYDILEIAPKATQKEIYNAYKKAKDVYSVDSIAMYSMFSEDETKELLRIVEEAYIVLSDHYKKQKYDETLNNKSLGIKPSNETNKIKSIDKTNDIIRTEEIANGTASTKFGSYSIDEDFEKEIKETKEFSGPLLQKIRLYKGITLEQLSKETCIGKTYLVAIESDDYGSLPAPVFVRGFLVQIAISIAINEKKVANSYMTNFKKSRAL